MTQGETYVGTTESVIDGWRVVVHWHDVRGRVVAAGVEVRSYDVPGDVLLDDPSPRDGLPDPHHEAGFFPTGRRAADVTSGVMGHQIRWGQVVREQLGQLVESLGRSAEDDPTGLAWADQVAERAAGGGGQAPRATAATYARVAELDAEVRKSGAARGREALAVLRLLRDRDNLPLDETSNADRSRVRAWMKTVRDQAR